MLRALALLVAPALLAGCSGGDEPSSSEPSSSNGDSTPSSSDSTEQPRTEAAARAIAQEEADRYAAGDFGGAWDLWADQAQSTITREDYIKLGERCLGAGAAIDVTDARLDGDARAVVRLGKGSFRKAYTMRYEDGAWRWMPTKQALADYDGNVDEVITRMERRGDCVPQ